MMMFVILFILTLLLIGGFVWGKCTNLKLIKQALVTLEKVFEPEKVEYKWLGGVLGVEGTYRFKHSKEDLKFSLLMLPRHSWLYLPIAYLRTRGDKLYIILKDNPKLSFHFSSSIPELNVMKIDDSIVLALRINWKTLEKKLKLLKQWL